MTHLRMTPQMLKAIQLFDVHLEQMESLKGSDIAVRCVLFEEERGRMHFSIINIRHQDCDCADGCFVCEDSLCQIGG